MLRSFTGPLTTELVQRPADHGLGLPRVPARLAPTSTVNTVCGFCSTGCSLKVHLGPDGQALNLSPNFDYPVNLGMACPKGWEALTPLAATDRATTPLVRDSSGKLVPTSWPHALASFVTNFKKIQAAHGPAAISFLSTGQMATEEMAFLGALFKFGMGGLHADSNTRQCMATSHVAYKQSLGYDAPPYTYKDFELSDTLIFIGANPAIAHPIMWQRVQMNKLNPSIIVIDPRRTETAMAATTHLPLRPKSDLALLYGVAHQLIKNNWLAHDYIANHTENFDAFAAFVSADTYNLPATAAASGLTEQQISDLAAAIHRGRAVSFWWTMGVNQSHESTRTAQALINLALMTGNIGRPGTGPNSITGQCNAMGSRLYGNTTSLIGGYNFRDARDRAHVAATLDIPVDKIPTEPSRAYDQILDDIDAGKIRGLWVICTNTAHSWINQIHFESLRSKLDYLVVQDLYPTTETARMADLVLPAAGWGEKEGTLINSERRYGVIRKVSRAPGQALSDFSIFKLIAEAWGCGEMFREWSSPEAAFQILKKLSHNRPSDITGIRDYAHLDASGGLQWPYTEDEELKAGKAERLKENQPGSEYGVRRLDAASEVGTSGPRVRSETSASETAGLQTGSDSEGPGGARVPRVGSGVPPEPSEIPNEKWKMEDGKSPSTSPSSALQPFSPSAFREARLFADGKFFTPSGKARFLFDAARPMPELPDADYPFILLTGRGSSAQWHTGSRTNKSDVLRKLAPTECYVEINPIDAERLHITLGQPVMLRSKRGQCPAHALITPTVQPGQLFLPMHWPDINKLTYPSFDPHSRQPSYKACAVTITHEFQC